MKDGIKEGRVKYTNSFRVRSFLYFLIRMTLFFGTLSIFILGGYYALEPKANIQEKIYNIHKSEIAIDDFVVWNDNEINLLDEILTNTSVNKPHLGKVLKVPGGVVNGRNNTLTTLKNFEYEVEDEMGVVKIINKDQIFGKINYQQ